MRKRMIWIIPVALLLANSAAPAEIGTVNRRQLLVRAGPSRKHKVIAKLDRGKRPLVEDLRGGWVKLAWKREAWVEKRGLSLKQGGAQSSVLDGQFLRWLIRDTKVNWAFIHRHRGDAVLLWVRMDSDRYGGVADVTFMARNLAESYRFHTGKKGAVDIRILKWDAKFIGDVYCQATFK